MKLFQRGVSNEEAVRQAEAALLREEAAALRGEVEGLRELVRHLDGDRTLLLEAVRRLAPGKPHPELGEIMHDLVFRPFDLASFYVAVMDWGQDLLTFPYYHEGGRARNHPSRRLSANPGLTGKALHLGKPLYTRTLEEAEALGALLTEAEKGSGLIPASWYGVPLGRGSRSSGLVSFQSFQRDAFPESRRDLLDALALLLGRAMFG